MSAEDMLKEIQERCDKWMADSDEFTIDNVLRSLIKESDLDDVIACLDMIAQEEEGQLLVSYDKNTMKRVYPAAGVRLCFEMKSCELDPVENIYTGSFFKVRRRLEWRVPIICDAIMEVFNIQPPEKSLKVQTIVDCGCAIGEYVAGFLDRGITSWGIEGSEAAEEFAKTQCISYYDLRLPLPSVMTASYNADKRLSDLCMSLEVAEHIDEEYSDIYLNNLCALSKTILMTAAGPGQKGVGHVNCQEKGYWEDKMRQRGYMRQPQLEVAFASALEAKTNRREVLVYAKNAMVFKLVK